MLGTASIPARPRAVYFTGLILNAQFELARGPWWTTSETFDHGEGPARPSAGPQVDGGQKGE